MLLWSRYRVVGGWTARGRVINKREKQFLLTGLDWIGLGRHLGIHAPSFLLACSRRGNIWVGTRSGQILISRPAWGAMGGPGTWVSLLLFLNIEGKMTVFLFLAHFLVGLPCVCPLPDVAHCLCSHYGPAGGRAVSHWCHSARHRRAPGRSHSDVGSQQGDPTCEQTTQARDVTWGPDAACLLLHVPEGGTEKSGCRGG